MSVISRDRCVAKENPDIPSMIIFGMYFNFTLDDGTDNKLEIESKYYNI